MKKTSNINPNSENSLKKRKKRRKSRHIPELANHLTKIPVDKKWELGFLIPKTAKKVNPIHVNPKFKQYQQPPRFIWDKVRPDIVLDVETDNMSWNFLALLEAKDLEKYPYNKTPFKHQQEFIFCIRGFISKYLHKYFPETKTDLYLRDQFCMAIHIVYTRTMFNSDKGFREKNTWDGKFYARIHSKYNLECLIGADYKKIIDILCSEGEHIIDGETVKRPAIIDRDNYYKTGVKSRGYRFALPKGELSFDRIPVRTSVVCKRIQRKRKNMREESYVTKHTFERLQRLTFSPQVFKYLTFLRENAETEEEKEMVAINEYHVSRFLNEDYHVKLDNQGRLHTNLTNMPSRLKQFLVCKETGKKLVQVDISNSQPLIFCGLLREEGIKGKNVERFIKLCQEGKIYEEIMEGIDWQGTRREFKSLFFGEVFFCGKWTMWHSEIGKYFKKTFPTVYKFLEKQKSESKSALPLKMQRLESKLVIKEILTNLYRNTWQRRNKTGGMFLSIHDSILCFEEDVEMVKRHFSKKFEQELKISIALKLEYAVKDWIELIPENVKDLFQSRRAKQEKQTKKVENTDKKETIISNITDNVADLRQGVSDLVSGFDVSKTLKQVSEDFEESLRGFLRYRKCRIVNRM